MFQEPAISLSLRFCFLREKKANVVFRVCFKISHLFSVVYSNLHENWNGCYFRIKKKKTGGFLKFCLFFGIREYKIETQFGLNESIAKLSYSIAFRFQLFPGIYWGSKSNRSKVLKKVGLDGLKSSITQRKWHRNMTRYHALTSSCPGHVKLLLYEFMFILRSWYKRITSHVRFLFIHPIWNDEWATIRWATSSRLSQSIEPSDDRTNVTDEDQFAPVTKHEASRKSNLRTGRCRLSRYEQSCTALRVTDVRSSHRSFTSARTGHGSCAPFLHFRTPYESS